jgi:integrase/recombinase XerD
VASLRVLMNTHPTSVPSKPTKTAPIRARREALPHDSEAVGRFIDTLKLRGLSPNTQSEYLRYIRKLAARSPRDPALLTEEELRAYIISLKTDSAYAPSTMRTAVAAFHCFYNTHLGREWILFTLIRCPDDKNLPEVLTIAEVRRLLIAVRLPRFRVLFGLLYACGLRLNEALTLEVTDIRDEGRHIHLRASQTKGRKARTVPLPTGTLYELRAYWKTHRHPRFIFPSLGCGWRDGPHTAARLHLATEPMQDGAAQACMRLARAAAGLPERVTAHTLRHCYATHLLEKGVNLRLISAYMGHASLDITAIYLHLTAVNEGHARDAIEQLQPVLPPLRF